MPETYTASGADFFVVLLIIVGTFICLGLILGTIEHFGNRRNRK